VSVREPEMASPADGAMVTFWVEAERLAMTFDESSPTHFAAKGIVTV
jgi:hypothetical protein